MTPPHPSRATTAASLAALALLTGISGCAPNQASRPTPAGSGWVEFTLTDTAIPGAPGLERDRPTCTLSLALDGHALLERTLEAQGDRPPYHLDEVFRFRVPPGSYRASVQYLGCRFVGKQADLLEAELQVPVRADLTTHIEFDGSEIRYESLRPLRTF